MRVAQRLMEEGIRRKNVSAAECRHDLRSSVCLLSVSGLDSKLVTGVHGLFYPSHKAHRAAVLISVSLALTQTPAYTACARVTTNTRLVHRAVCLFTSQLLQAYIASTHGGMARLS